MLAYPKYEVIIVYDAYRKGPGYCRNEALKLSKGDLIYFIDDDAIAEADNLLNLVKFFTSLKEGNNVVGGVQGVLITHQGSRAFNRVSFTLFGLKLMYDPSLQETEIITTCNALLPKSVLERVCGFDERISYQYDDVDLSLKIRSAGFKLYTALDAKVYHEGVAEKGEIPDKQFYASKNLVLLYYKWYSLRRALFLGLFSFLGNMMLVFASAFACSIARLAGVKNPKIGRVGLPQIRFQQALGALYGLTLLGSLS
jgi:GT2 family glycosyltransferase